MIYNYLKLTLIFTLFSLQLNAQVKQGGTPKALQNNLKSLMQEIELPAVSESWKATHETLAEKNGTVQPISKNIETNFNLENSGTWLEKKNGDRIWRLKVKANNAIGINPLFKNFYLPEEATLFVYNNDFSQILGSYTNQNNHSSGYFATEIIFGDEMIIEYFEPKEVRNEGHFTIEKVGSFYKDLIHTNTKNFGDSENCQVNINCSEGDNWLLQKKGVARILVQGSSGSGWCSGSLINNTSQNKEYFLTAYHCGNNSSIADFNQWIFYFKYEFNGCGSSSFEPTNTNTITGAQVIARSNDLNSTTVSSDFLLLELNSAVPSSYDPYYNGWNLSSSTSSSGVSIHHPSGDVKKISTFSSTPSTVGIVWSGSGYSVITGLTHWSNSWANTTNGTGVTEGGSSGSPLFNASGQIIGTLSGGSSSCTNLSSNDQYGKMSYHWTSNATANNRRLKPWLDPNNSGVNSLAGAESPGNGAGTFINDVAISAILSPTSSNCDVVITPRIKLQNSGIANLLSANISYVLNSGGSVNLNWTGLLAPGESEEITLASTLANNQNNDIVISASNPNGLTDGNLNNNSLTLDFDAGVSIPIPFYENFEANPTDNNLTILNSDNDETWSFSEFGGFETSSNAVFIDNWDYDAVGQYDWFVTDAYDFTNITDEELQFDLAYAYYQPTDGTPPSYDSLGVAVSLDCGESFFWLWKEGGVELATKQGGTNIEFTPSLNDWERKVISLSELNGEASVQFAFIAINGFGNNLYLDNILVGKDFVNINKLNALENEVKLYPNPAKDFISLEYNSDEKLSFTIQNTIGQSLKTGELSKENSLETINVSKLTKGIYYIEVKSASSRKVLKFVKE